MQLILRAQADLSGEANLHSQLLLRAKSDEVHLRHPRDGGFVLHHQVPRITRPKFWRGRLDALRRRYLRSDGPHRHPDFLLEFGNAHQHRRNFLCPNHLVDSRHVYSSSILIRGYISQTFTFHCLSRKASASGSMTAALPRATNPAYDIERHSRVWSSTVPKPSCWRIACTASRVS